MVIQQRLAAGESEPRCFHCGGPLRGATILFGEELPAEALQRAVVAARESDLMLVVGTSLVVNPAAQLPRIAKQRGAHLAIINRTPTPLDAITDVRIVGEAGSSLTALAAGVLGQDWERVFDDLRTAKAATGDRGQA
jgi:NAD-dependent deacetylase